MDGIRAVTTIQRYQGMIPSAGVGAIEGGTETSGSKKHDLSYCYFNIIPIFGQDSEMCELTDLNEPDPDELLDECYKCRIMLFENDMMS